MNKSKSTPRRALHAFVSSDAHDGWHDYAGAHGVSTSALLEVIGKSLAEDVTSLRMNLHVDAARMVDAANRRRRRS
jgi:hypothetical protein